MKKIQLLLLLLLLQLPAMAQEKGQKTKISFSGFISNDICYTSRQTVMARDEGQFILAPKAILLDEEGNDINAASSFNIVGIASRLRTKITGPDAFGARTSALVEGDFLGLNKGSKFHFRLRHAYVKLDWDNTQLLVGQYWHPMFIPTCFPGTVSFGAGAPFNPLARNPQFRYSYTVGKTKFSATASTNGHFLNKGSAGAQMTAVMPELNLQAQFNLKNFLGGFGFGYKVLQPEIVTSENYITDNKVKSSSFFGYVKWSGPQVTIKTYGTIGSNNDNLVMIGGYAVVDSPVLSDKGMKEYTPYSSFSTWVDIHSNGKKVVAGLFAGYSENLGADKSIDTSTFVGRWSDVHSFFRIAPRVVFISGSMRIGTEVEYGYANYLAEASGYDNRGKVNAYEKADNLKLLVNVKYNF
jgi:hypothetical protein